MAEDPEVKRATDAARDRARRKGIPFLQSIPVGDDRAVAGIAAQLEQLEQAVAVVAKKADAAQLAGNPDELEARVAALETGLVALRELFLGKTGEPTPITALQQAVDALAQAAGGLPAAFAEIGGKLAALDVRLQAIEAKNG